MKINEKQVKEICKRLGQDFIGFDFLGRGSHNVNYIINTPQERFVLRIEDNLQFDNLKKEYKFLRKTDGKLGPRVFLFDDSRNILNKTYFVEEFIEGKHPKKADINYIKLMARWYKELHKVKVKRKMLPLRRRLGVRKYKKFNHILDVDIKSRLDDIYDQSIKLFNKHDDLFKNITHLSLNHGDPTRTNVFYDGKRVRLIDWEMVHYNIPEADLVFFVWSYELNEKRKKIFLATYGYSKTDKSKLKFELRLLAHIWEMISWRLERLDLVYRKKIDNIGYCSTKEDVYDENEKDIKKMNKILRLLKNGD
ncbi:MAG TPA: aminoglycoside phosphotransferase family protein [Candidatus Pacearchaeota archaeon]|nr:aminoglycoside phosphotransferase family protein [Candidatus Pacearchaeota archaeon]